jgi:lambda family phage tail tape measure protein
MATTVENVEIRVDANQANTVLRNLERNIDGVTGNFRDFAEGVRDGMTQALREAGLLDAATKKLGNSTKLMKDFAAGVKSGMRDSLKETTALSKNIDATAKSVAALGRTAKTSLPQITNLSQLGGGRFLSLENITGGLVAGTLLRGAYQQAEQTRGMSEANLAASMASSQMAKNFENLRQAIINVTEPLNKLIAGVSISVSALEAFLKALAAIVLSFAAFKALTLVTSVMNGLQKVLTTTSAGAYGLGKALGEAYASFLRLIGLGSGVAKIAGWSGKLFTLAGVFAALSRFILRFAGWVGVIIAVAQAVDFLVQAIFKFSVLDWASKKWDTLISKLREWLGLQKEIKKIEPPSPGPMGRVYSKEDMDRMAQAEQQLSQQRIDAMKATDDLLRSTSRQNQSTLEQLRLQNKLFGASEDYAEIQRTLLQQEQNRRDVVQGIRDQIAAGVAPSVKILLEQQIASYLKLQTAADAQAIAEIKALQKKRAELAAYNIQLNTMVELSNAAANRRNTLADILGGQRGALGDVLFQRSQLGRGGIQQQIASAYEDARKAAREAQQQFAATFPEEGFTPETAREFQQGLDAIAKSFEEVAFQTENNILISQQWKTGWDEAFNNFIDQSLNAADRARETFGSIVKNMENALDNFVMTGKLNFRDLARSIIADLLKIELKAASMNFFASMRGSFLGTLFSSFAGFFAQGGYIPPGKTGVVGEAGPELVTGPATVTPMSGVMGGGQQVINNYYINALDAKSVAQLFSENRRTLLGATEQARKELPVRQRF